MDRLYLDAYPPQWKSGRGVVIFFKEHRETTVTCTTLMAPRSRAFVRQIEPFTQTHDFNLIGFGRGEHQEDITHQYLRRFD